MRAPPHVMKIERYSHGVRLSEYDPDLANKLFFFLERLKLKEPRKLPAYQGGGMVLELKKRFYGITEDRKEIFIHRHHLDDLTAFLSENGYGNGYTVTEIPPPDYAPIDVTVRSHITPRPYQTPIIDNLTNTHYSNKLDLQTGKGKTLTSLMSIGTLCQRTVINIPPKYFGIWVEALYDAYDGIEQRYVTVAGSGELKKLMELALDEETFDYDFIIISNTTYKAYLDNYEKWGETISEMGYLVPPPRFHELVKAGVQINDEIQENPGLVFRTDIFTNVRKQIYLSATPYTGNDYVTRMIDVMLPAHTQCPLPELDVYINVIGLLYGDPTVKPQDYTTPFKGTYNHARYETQMLKQKRRLKAYFALVKKMVVGLYTHNREPGQKLLILCATVDFIKALTKYLNVEFPDLQVGLHVSGSDYKKLATNDITVSTIKSSGTGVDIPNLREVLMLQATDSKKDNIQVLGRLRRMKDWPEVTPRMTYLACTHIKKHLKYHRSKQEYFGNRVLNHKVMKI